MRSSSSSLSCRHRAAAILPLRLVLHTFNSYYIAIRITCSSILAGHLASLILSAANHSHCLYGLAFSACCLSTYACSSCASFDMYGQQAPLLAQQPSLSVALASAETRSCPCCPTSPFIYNRFIGGYTVTLILQWLSLIFLIAGTATPALFVAIGNGFTVTYGLFHACIVTVVGTRKCYPYEDDGAQLLGSSHLGQEWSAYQALSVTLNVLAFAVGVLYTLRMAVLQRSKSLPRRSELALISAASFVLVLAVVSISLFVNCYNHVLLPAPVNVKTLGSSFTLSIAAYILQVSALLFHCYTYYQHTKASGGSVAAAAIPLRAGEPEPVPMAVVADPSAQYHPAYTPAAASYMQPAFYGQAYQLPQQYMQPAQGGAVPSYYSPPQYYAPAQQPQHMPAFAHQQPYPATPVVHYGEVAAAQQQAPMAAPQ